MPSSLKNEIGLNIISHIVIVSDIVAEWLRRWIANPLLFERESSNLSDVVFLV
jgi:hypothetical protein